MLAHALYLSLLLFFVCATQRRRRRKPQTVGQAKKGMGNGGITHTHAPEGWLVEMRVEEEEMRT